MKILKQILLYGVLIPFIAAVGALIALALLNAAGWWEPFSAVFLVLFSILPYILLHKRMNMNAALLINLIFTALIIVCAVLLFVASKGDLSGEGMMALLALAAFPYLPYSMFMSLAGHFVLLYAAIVICPVITLITVWRLRRKDKQKEKQLQNT